MTHTKKETKILAVYGSPRKKGNSTVLANQIILGAASEGAKVETVYLNGLNIKPCQGCYNTELMQEALELGKELVSSEEA